MKEVFLKVRDCLINVPDIKFADLDKGQLDYYEQRPNVAFPCALVDFDVNHETISGNIQRVTGNLIVRVAFDYTGDSSFNASPQRIRGSLEYLNVIDAVKASLHDFTDDQIELIDLRSNAKEGRSDGFTVRRLTFEITYNEVI